MGGTYQLYRTSKMQWLPPVPEHWDEQRAKVFFREVDERSRTGEEELLSVSHLTGVTPRSQKKVTMFKAASYVGSKLCRPGDIVINTLWAWMAALGASRHVGIVSPAYGVYRPHRPDSFNPAYLDYLLRTRAYVAEYIGRSTGIRSSRLRLYPNQFLDIALIQPPRTEQDQMVAYSPSLRDDAQDARNRLFNLITEIPGKACYTVIKQLIKDHPEPDYRPRMSKRAYQRAEADGDLEAWSAKQVCDFALSQTITPTTHRQIFELAVQRLIDLKNWLERGNDSPWETWQRATQETEMRKLIAGWLNQKCQSQYVTAQENELANSQRMDILLQNSNVQSPVPIELKLLDKNWSGPDLCERLRNQLAGDYLREESAGCGVFLLVAQNVNPIKRWKISGRNVPLNELADALKKYWDSISGQYSGVLAIDVIVIDLAQRARVSDS